MPFATRKLVAQEVYEVLTSEDSAKIISEKLGISPSAVHKIRKGQTYKSVCPEIEREPVLYDRSRSCQTCVHYTYKGQLRSKCPINECDLSIPEIKSHLGIRAAAHCAYYQ